MTDSYYVDTRCSMTKERELGLINFNVENTAENKPEESFSKVFTMKKKVRRYYTVRVVSAI